MKKTTNGFTVVELLIVIVVIAILAAISVVAYNGIQDRARVARANNDLITLRKAIEVARVSQSRTLLQITGNSCTRCSTNQPTVYHSTLTAIANASGTNLDGMRAGDPWGSLYQIDENEGEGGNCTRDALAISPGRAEVPVVYIPTYAC